MPPKVTRRPRQPLEGGVVGRHDRERVFARVGDEGEPAGPLGALHLAGVVEATGVSRAELTKRAQFAERFPTEPELRNGITQFRSWFAIVRDALPRRAVPGAHAVACVGRAARTRAARSAIRA